MTEMSLPLTTIHGLCPNKAFEYTAQQLDHEVERSNARTSRFLTFTGLLFASLAIAARAPEEDPLRIALMNIAPFAGLVMAFATFTSVRAAQRARDRIKTYWRTTGLADHYPPLYSDGAQSIMGRFASTGLIAVIGVIWLGLLVEAPPYLRTVMSGLWGLPSD